MDIHKVIADAQSMANERYELWRIAEVKAERAGQPAYTCSYAREMRQRWELAQAKVYRAQALANKGN